MFKLPVVLFMIQAGMIPGKANPLAFIVHLGYGSLLGVVPIPVSFFE